LRSPEYKNLVICAVHKFMIARQSECFNDLTLNILRKTLI